MLSGYRPDCPSTNLPAPRHLEKSSRGAPFKGNPIQGVPIQGRPIQGGPHSRDTVEGGHHSWGPHSRETPFKGDTIQGGHQLRGPLLKEGHHSRGTLFKKGTIQGEPHSIQDTASFLPIKNMLAQHLSPIWPIPHNSKNVILYPSNCRCSPHYYCTAFSSVLEITCCRS